MVPQSPESSPRPSGMPGPDDEEPALEEASPVPELESPDGSPLLEPGPELEDGAPPSEVEPPGPEPDALTDSLCDALALADVLVPGVVVEPASGAEPSSLHAELDNTHSAATQPRLPTLLAPRNDADARTRRR